MTTQIHQTFGKAVRARRELLGLSQEALAKKTRMPLTYVCATERGERNVSLRDIIVIADALHCEPADLFPEEREGSEESALWLPPPALNPGPLPPDITFPSGMIKPPGRSGQSIQ